MKKSFLTLFFFAFIHICAAQEDLILRLNNAKEEYANENYETAAAIITEIKPQYRNPPPVLLALEILINLKIIEANPMADYKILEETRNLVSVFENNLNATKAGNYYYLVDNEKYKLSTYPLSEELFNEIIRAKELEEQKERERIEREALLARQKAEQERQRKIEEEKRMQLIAARRQKLRFNDITEYYSDTALLGFSESSFDEMINRKIKAREEERAEKARIENARLERLTILKPYIDYVSSYDRAVLGTYSDETFKEIYKKARKDSRAVSAFSSIGYIGGTVAKHGGIYEYGGNFIVGFHVSFRSSFTSREEILSGENVENKSEIQIGPNFRLFNRLYLNLGIGTAGFQKKITIPSTGELDLELVDYTVYTGGLMVRLTNFININGGVSLMRVNKDIFEPEFTFGGTFNLKVARKKLRY